MDTRKYLVVGWAKDDPTRPQMSVMDAPVNINLTAYLHDAAEEAYDMAKGVVAVEVAAFAGG